MAGSIIKTGEKSWLVSFGKKGSEGSIFERFDDYKEAQKFWKSKQEVWKRAEGTWRSTPDSIKVRAYLGKLKPGSRIHVTSIAEELNISRNVVDDQINLNFKNKFKRSKRPYDTEIRRAFTKDGIKFEPKLFKYKNKQGKTQNPNFYQDATTGEWKVLTHRGGELQRKRVIDTFKEKAAALQFIEDKKLEPASAQLKKYLDEAFIKNKGKKLTFESLKDVGIKAGVPNMLEGDISRVLRFPKYRRTVKKFPFTIASEQPLNKSQIDSIKKQFGAEQPKEGWNFKTKINPDGFKYGVSQSKLQQRIKSSLLDQPWRYGFSIHKAPGAWMLVQMDRAAKNKDPKYESIFDKEGKVIGMKEDGAAYYANRKLAPSNASKLIQSHPQFEQVQKIVDIAAKANEPLIAQTDKASRAVVDLFPKGFDSSRVSLSRLLAYLYEHKGLASTKNAINVHHIEALKRKGSPVNAENLMLARADHNMLAGVVDKMVGKQEPDISRVPELKEARVKIKVDDILYGRGTRDPAKYIREQTEEIYKPLRKYKTKDWTNLQNYFVKSYDRLIKEGTAGGPICGLKVVKNVALNRAAGGPLGPDCSTQVKQVLQENPDQLIKEAAEAKVKPGQSTGFRNIARQILTKIPKGGRLGAILAGAGAVGAGTWAMTGGAKAEEPPTTEQMTYNSITGTFDNAEGDPETQEGVLNWIADNPIKSGLAPIPIGIGVGLGAEAMGAKQVGNFFKSMKFILPPAYAAEKLHQYKRGDDMGQMFANPIDAVWAMALDTPTSARDKWNYYKNIAQKRVGIGPVAKGAVEAEKLGLRHLDPRKFKETGQALKRATMAPRSFGTSLVFPFAGPKAGAGAAMKVFRGAARLAPLGPLPMALLAGSMAWDKYKFNKKVGDHVDALRAKGVVSEDDAQSMNTIYKQGWLGTTAIGAKILGSEELMLDGEMADIEKQKEVLAKMKEYYEGREDVAAQERAGERQEDFFDWFSKGGRVGLAEGGNKPPFGMTRRSFLKWLVGSIVAGVAAVSGKGLKQAAKTATATVAKTPAKFIGVEGMPLWFPRAVAKIKTHGKLLEMADKHYVTGDRYEMMIPVKIKRSLSGRKGHTETVMEQRKVVMEDNPLTGEIDMQWTGTDNFGGDAVRHISFKPGSSGYQKFGVDPDHPQAWEYQRVKVEEPEFSYTQPDQSRPMRDDVEYLDIFEEGDEIVKGLEDMTGSKNMVTKDGTVFNVKEYSPADKSVDEAFQKKIYKDIEGEDALVPDPEGKVGPEGDWLGDSPNEMIGGDVPEWVPKEKMWDPTKKASGGIIETGNIARRPGAVPPLSGPDPQGQGIVGLFSSPKRVNIT